MGAQRIQEDTMFALLFLLVGVIFLLAAAGRIWLDSTPLDSPIVDSNAAHGSGDAVSPRHMPGGRDSMD